MSNFSKARKYYTSAEVEKKIKDLLSKSELKIHEQNAQIVGLRAQIEKQQKEIKELKKRERVIRSALISATDKAKEAYDEAKKKRAYSLERLDNFKKKYVLKLEQIEKLEASSFNDQLSEILEDLKLGVGAAELARRKELEKAREKLVEANAKNKISQKELESRYSLVLEKYNRLNKQKQEEFSIEEALNPTASLEEIMKEIFKK